MAYNFAYKNNRDIKFILKEWLPLENVLAYPRFRENYGLDDLDPIFDTIMKICKEVIEPSADDGEKNPVRFDNGKVILPPTIAPLYKKLQEEGWGTSNIDKSEGAMTLPASILYPVWELFAAANPAFVPPFLAMPAGSAELIQSFGDEHVKKMFLPKMLDGTWAGTMCLTEPSAGSDVGDILSRAYPTEHPRIFKIKGQKIFITDGENDFSENIIHLYLARVEGALPGTRGISLFVVPKNWVNEDGTLEPNDIVATGIEHKMGNHGNPTVALSLGDNNQCRGWLLGKNPLENGGKGEGMAQMFQMMNTERLGIGLMCTAMIANAYCNARDYARERIQGRPLTNPRGDRVAIIQHEDTKRSLLSMKAHVEAMRAMVCKSLLDIDIKHWDPDPQAREKAANEIEVNTPLCKAYCSEEAWGLIAEAIQVYGGYGYCEDYPVERLARDCKIHTIWEGTNYVQSMDLIGRKWTMQGGTVFAGWMQNIKDFYEAHKEEPGFTREFAELGDALSAYGEIQTAIGGFFANKQFSMLPVYSKRILMATAQMYAGSLILDQALLADRKAKELGPEHYDYKFYQGKIMAARYYLLNVVPNVRMVAELVKKADTSVLDIDIDSFDY